MRRPLWLLGVVLSGIAAANGSALEPPATPSMPHWLSGHWRSHDDGRVTDEVWLAPADGLMTGMSRTHGGGRKAFFEFLRVEQRGNALVYVAQPGGGAATEFTAANVSDDRVEFANSAHDFPQRIIYQRRDRNHLDARIEGIVDGKTRQEQWSYERVPTP